MLSFLAVSLFIYTLWTIPFFFSVIIETQSVYGSIKLIHDNISE